MTQQQPYSVRRTFEDFELRRYPEYVLVQARVDSDFATAGNLGFRPLFRYISGDNQSSTKFAMTAPVIQEEQAVSGQTVSFVLPEGLDVSTIPLPRDTSVNIKRVPAHDAAVRRFTGGWSEDRFRRQGEALLVAVQEALLKPSGTVYYARFDPPWKPGFLKHNEVLVKIDVPS